MKEVDGEENDAEREREGSRCEWWESVRSWS